MFPTVVFTDSYFNAFHIHQLNQYRRSCAESISDYCRIIAWLPVRHLYTLSAVFLFEALYLLSKCWITTCMTAWALSYESKVEASLINGGSTKSIELQMVATDGLSLQDHSYRGMFPGQRAWDGVLVQNQPHLLQNALTTLRVRVL